MMSHALKFFIILTVVVASISYLSRPSAPLSVRGSRKPPSETSRNRRPVPHTELLVLVHEITDSQPSVTSQQPQRKENVGFSLASRSPWELLKRKIKEAPSFNALSQRGTIKHQTQETAGSDQDIVDNADKSDPQDFKGNDLRETANTESRRGSRRKNPTEWHRSMKSSSANTDQQPHRLIKRSYVSLRNRNNVHKQQHFGDSTDVNDKVLAVEPHSSADNEDRSARSTAYNIAQVHNSSCFFNNTYVNCSSRGLYDVPTDLFPTTVSTYSLRNNSITNIEEFAFSGYTALKVLDLSHNNLLCLHNDSFVGLGNLLHLNLSVNKLNMTAAYIPANVFAPLESLEILWLHRNTPSMDQKGINLTDPDVALSKLKNLKELYMDGLEDKDFGPGFKNLTKLHTLSLSGEQGYCKLRSLRNATFINVPNIKNLSLDACQIDGDFVEADAFTPLTNLAHLDLSDNSNIGIEHLNKIFYGLHKTTTLKSLVINRVMSFHSIARQCLDSKYISNFPQYLEILDAGYNDLEGVDRYVIEKLSPSLKVLDISENAFAFGTYLKDLPKMTNLTTLLYNGNGDEERYVPKLPHNFPQKKSTQMAASNCSLDQTTPHDMHYIELEIKLPPKLKHVEMNNIGLMFRLTYFNIDVLNELESLSMYGNYFPLLSGRIIGFSCLKSFILRSNKIRYISKSFFEGITPLEILDLSSNRLSTVYDERGRKPLFSSLFRLKFLNLSSNEITGLHYNTFQGLESLIELDLSKNRLEEFPVNMSLTPMLKILNLSHNELTSFSQNAFDGLERLKELHLGNNRLGKFLVNMSHILNLKVLDLSYNQITLLPDIVRGYIDLRHENITLSLAGCPIVCTCNNFDFLKWFSQSKFKVKKRKLAHYRCTYPDNSYKDVTDLFKSTVAVLSRECISNYAIFLVSGATTLFLLCLIIGGFAYRFRWNLRYFYYAAYLRYKKVGTNRDADYEFDVFISYAEEDSDFVVDVMTPELENRGVKMLIHGRDFKAGEYIATNIVNAVRSSKQTLVVLTRNMMNSYWCGYELQMANMESVQRGGKVLIFLLMEKIPESELGVELLYNIRNNTYIPYPDTLPDDRNMGRLWDKLVADIKN